MPSSNVKVSVFCLAYNHEAYIRDALDGFVKQKTNFPYEVIVHDDASTDRTAEIIREYAEKYPEIIKPIYQTENQYSKGIKITQTYIFPKLQGEYVAICEGDDYWTDENKLQMQFDFMEKHRDYVACAHNTLFDFLQTGEKRVFYSSMDQEVELKDAIVGGGMAYHTSSLFYRREFLFNRPSFVSTIPGVGDYPLAIYLSLSGKVMRFGKVMSVYRLGREGSWTRNNIQNIEKMIALREKTITMLNMANEYSKFTYDELFRERIVYFEYLILKLKGDYKSLKSKKYKHYYKAETPREKCRLWLRKNFPFLFKRKAK